MKFFLFLLIIVFVSACHKCEDTYEYCTSEKLSWIAGSDGRTVIFEKNDGLFDTVHADQMNIQFVEVSPASMDGRTCAAYLQKAEIGLRGTFHNMQISVDGFSSSVVVVVDTHLFGGIDFTHQDNVTIHGTLYNSVYISEHDTSYISQFAEPRAWKVFYSLEQGILRIDYTKGEYWEKI